MIVMIYLLICLITTTWIIILKQENRLLKAIFILFFPVLGPIFLLLFLRRKSVMAPLETDEVGEGETPLEESELINEANLSELVDVVPIRDALLLNDNKIRRKVLIQSLRENRVKSATVLQDALQNDDSETSHYAATAIMALKRNRILAIQETEQAWLEDPDDNEMFHTYIDALHQYLEIGFDDADLSVHYQQHYIGILAIAVEQKRANEQTFETLIRHHMQKKEFEKAQYYCAKFIERYPSLEKAYLLSIQMHYTHANMHGIQKMIELLMKRPVQLSANGLQVIRFWSVDRGKMRERSYQTQ